MRRAQQRGEILATHRGDDAGYELIFSLEAWQAPADGQWWQQDPIRFLQTNLSENDSTVDPKTLVNAVADFGANTFLPDFLHSGGQPELVGLALTAVNLAQVPASFIVGLLPWRLLARRTEGGSS